MHFSLEKLLNYTGNRYQLARACMEYAKRVRHVAPDEYLEMGEKEALISIKHVLNEDIKYTSDAFEIEIYEDEAEVIISQREMEMQRKLKKEEAVAKAAIEEEEDDDDEEEESATTATKNEEKTSSKTSSSATKDVKDEENKETQQSAETLKD